MTTFSRGQRFAIAIATVVLASACGGSRVVRPCPPIPEPLLGTEAPDPRREPPALIRAALEEASDEIYVRLQPALNSSLLLDEVTPELAEAYARRWLRLAMLPREWFVEHIPWEHARDDPDDDGPIRRLAGDPTQLVGANARLPIAEALAAGRITNDARPDAIVIVGSGGVPVAEAIRSAAATWSAAERRQLETGGVLLPPTARGDVEPPHHDEGARVWFLDDPLRPLSKLPAAVRERIVTRAADAIDPAPLTPSQASRALAEVAAAQDRAEGVMTFIGSVQWQLDLVQFPFPVARELVRTVPHAPLDADQREQLLGGTTWIRSATREIETRGDLGAINALTRWRVHDAAPVLRACARRNGNFYPADAASVALASMGDSRALAWLDEMLARGPNERVWQLLQQPMPYAATPEIIDLLLNYCADGRREALDVLELMRRWFGAQVEARCAGAYDRAAAVTAWRDWWATNRSGWCWDPWSARFWPNETWQED